MKPLKERTIIMKGAGEMASGIACRLHRSGFYHLLMLETSFPLAVRREVSFCEAVHDGQKAVEGIEAVRIDDGAGLSQTWETGRIALMVDPKGDTVRRMQPDILIDATIAKRNLGTAIADAPLVIALGPGFTAGTDCHVVVETNRGHNLGRLITAGQAEPNTGIPGNIGGFTSERVLRAPASGLFTTGKTIGDPIVKGECIGQVGTEAVVAAIDGILRGLIRPGSQVTTGLKIGDIDPRGEAAYCHSVSEKARALGGSVLEAILAAYNR
ncbi:selenium-dependent molybdenum cofactor biosynthesis protein YqeB [Geotalea sp. SG265]|uniref:selenium-dependent molybdenum cofactor biosynthesis protein YqeB n=1 Tax=Geotalea sp. SG265 TaxID=2922867 RepID=UPI001FAE7B14|nr:selenium-dependent molybdenum cofactor biosynthesis protein YqeB [Geotalea sp. SG265]